MAYNFIGIVPPVEHTIFSLNIGYYWTVELKIHIGEILLSEWISRRF